jgi:DUF4097 and DUF4098 domain-containing protein YvlB
MKHEFHASAPQDVYVELQSGDLRVSATETDRADVEVIGSDADSVIVEQRGDQLSVIAPRRTGFFFGGGALSVTVTVPTGSNLVTKLGSAPVAAVGPLGYVRISTGSGEVSLEEVARQAVVKTGSGTIRIDTVGAEAELKAGSGEILVGSLSGQARLATGSGAIEVGHTAGAVSLKSGSGDLSVETADGDVQLSTASGDLRVGRMHRGQAQLKNVSGDIRLGIPDGTPVWTDISSSTGQVRSTLTPTGAPAEGQDHVRVRAKTVTGDVYLEKL